MRDKKKNPQGVAIVGLGYVGLPLALLASRKGFKVFGIDVNPEKVKKINSRESVFEDQKIDAELKTTNLKATTDFRVIEKVDTIVICVPTPVHHHHPDLKPLKAASIAISRHLQKGQLVILESTVNPGATEDVVLPILQKNSGLKAGEDFYLSHCPERINPGDPDWNVANIPRVIGGLGKESLEKTLNFYRVILDAPLMPMSSIKEAEAVKIVENSFRDINIAFVNELAMSFSHLGIDTLNVIRGAATKPFSFMPHFPGCGVGGHCIPVDPYYLIEYARENGFRHRFLELARDINEEMPRFTAEETFRALNEKGIPVSGSKVALLGLAYKGDIDDHRESPAFKIADHLASYGAEVRVFDPFIPDRSTVPNLNAALEDAQAAVIATGHTAFKNLTPHDFLSRGVSIVIDGRNCLSKRKFLAEGVTYRGIGR